MKTIVSLLVISSFIFLCFCTSSRKTVASAPVVAAEKKPKTVTVTYGKHIEPIMITYCVPCHFPESDGKDGPLDNYDTVKAQINDIIYRIELEPKERGFMPVKDKKLPDSVIQVFHQWKKEGLNK